MNQLEKKKPLSVKNQLQKHPSSVIRAGLQILFFFLSPGLFNSAFGGAKTIASTIGKGQAIAWSAHITTLVLLLVFTLLFGRIFCGSACSFGAFGDLVYFLAGPLRRKIWGNKSPTPPRGLRFLKYGVLVGILALCAAGGQSQIRGRSPWDAFAQLISGRVHFDGYVVGYVLLVLLLFGMGAVPRFFCRFLCPMGAIFSLLPPALLVRVKKPTAQTETHRACGSCTLCSKSCPAGLTLNSADAVTSGECFACCRCVDACYQQKPRLALLGLKLDSRILFLALGLLLAAFVLILGL